MRQPFLLFVVIVEIAVLLGKVRFFRTATNSLSQSVDEIGKMRVSFVAGARFAT